MDTAARSRYTRLSAYNEGCGHALSVPKETRPSRDSSPGPPRKRRACNAQGTDSLVLGKTKSRRVGHTVTLKPHLGSSKLLQTLQRNEDNSAKSFTDTRLTPQILSIRGTAFLSQKYLFELANALGMIRFQVFFTCPQGDRQENVTVGDLTAISPQRHS